MKLENLDPTELELLKSMNSRALKIYRIEQFFLSKKIPIDMKYLDSLKDEKLTEIYKTHCDGE